MAYETIYLDLIVNLTLLVALSVVSGFVDKRLSRGTLPGRLLQGLLFGGTAVIGMLRPLTLGPGLIFDGRSVMVSLCALFFGPWAAFVAGLATIGCRLSLGGSGAFTGALVILSSAGIGLFVRWRRNPDEKPLPSTLLYLLGLVVHLAMLALMFTLPAGAGLGVVKRIGLPVLILYPLAMILVGKILSDQVETERAVKALRKNEEKYRTILRTALDGFLETDLQGRILDVNEAYCRMSGYGAGELGTMRISDLDALESTEETGSRIERIMANGEDRFESRHRRRDGSVFDVAVNVQYRTGDSGWFVSFFRDITERKKSEKWLRQALEEKEILLREVHHRVKNNLNIISSLLSLQASEIKTPQEAWTAFLNSRDRILAMALVHEELYKSRDYARVDMGEYLDKLVGQLSKVYSPDRKVRLVARAEGIALSVSSSIPCGLILNELVTNAFKHAFPSGRGGEIAVALRQADDSSCELSVRDDGVGFPDERDGQGRGSLGLTLVRLLVEQLEGRMEVDKAGGTAFVIRFPHRDISDGKGRRV